VVPADPRCADVLSLLAGITDPRDARGRRHGLGYVLALVLAAHATTGFASLVGTAVWAASAPPRVLLALGGVRDVFTAAVPVPSPSTLGRVLAGVDPGQLAAAAHALTATLSVRPLAGLRALAVDGKTVRGARRAPTGAPHLVAVVTHATITSAPVVLTQHDTRAATGGGSTGGQVKKGEAAAARTLLADLDLSATVVTFDAAHTYPATAKAVTDAGGHYLLVIKANQPRLLAATRNALSGPDTTFPGHDEHTRGHGRLERRTLRATPVTTASAITFPGAAQVLRITRRRKRTSDRAWASKEIIYLVTSLPPHQGPPALLAALARGHWGIEALHHVRDTTFAEDACQVRTAHAPVNLTTLRNMIITLIRTAGGTITATRRWATATHWRVLKLLTGKAKPDIPRL